jgi:hypothetical protein
MRQPPLDPDAADEAPVADALTAYDQEHLVTYLRLLDAETDGSTRRRRPASFFMSLLTASQLERAAHGRPI